MNSNFVALILRNLRNLRKFLDGSVVRQQSQTGKRQSGTSLVV